MLFRKKMDVNEYCTARLEALLSVERHDVWIEFREQCNDSALSGIEVAKYLDHIRAVMFELLLIAITKKFRGNVSFEAHIFGRTYLNNQHVAHLHDIAHEYNKAFASTPYDGIVGIVLSFSNQLTAGRLKKETMDRLYAEFIGVLVSLFDDFKSIKLTTRKRGSFSHSILKSGEQQVPLGVNKGDQPDLEFAHSVDANWDKLSKGMTFDEVNALIEINGAVVRRTTITKNPGKENIRETVIERTSPKYYLRFVNLKLEEWHR